jgi:transcription elongation factor GreA
MQTRHVLTPAGYQELCNKFRQLKQRRQELIDRLDDMDDDPGEEEGATFDTIRERENIEILMRDIREQLNNVTINDGNIPTDVVAIGNRVTVFNVGREEWLTFDIVGSVYNSSSARMVTAESPVGAALIGKRVGDTMSIETPDGPYTYRITQIKQTPNPKSHK